MGTLKIQPMRLTIWFTTCGLAAALAGSALTPATASVIGTMVSVPQSVKEIIEELDRATAEAKQSGGGAGRGGRSREQAAKLEADATAKVEVARTRPAARREAATAAIRRFRRDASLKLNYLATTSNPYRDDESLIESYADEQGNEYWIDPARDFLVQMGPSARTGQAPYQVRPADRLPVAELRRLAVELIEAGLADFAQRRSSLHPLEDNRDRQVYFFRWDDFSAPLRESELPPFVQVALYADGRLASFTDTLSR